MTLDEIETLVQKAKKAQYALDWLRDADALISGGAVALTNILSLGIAFGSSTGAGNGAKGYLKDLNDEITTFALQQIENRAKADLEAARQLLPWSPPNG